MSHIVHCNKYIYINMKVTKLCDRKICQVSGKTVKFSGCEQYLVEMSVSEQSRAVSYTVFNAHPYLKLLNIHTNNTVYHCNAV